MFVVQEQIREGANFFLKSPPLTMDGKKLGVAFVCFLSLPLCERILPKTRFRDFTRFKVKHLELNRGGIFVLVATLNGTHELPPSP